MSRRNRLAGSILLAVCAALSTAAPSTAEAQWGVGQPSDWGRFYYYPYVYYPENFRPLESYDNLYYRYPQNRQIPVYNKMWHNEYPSQRPYHSGHHFVLDVF